MLFSCRTKAEAAGRAIDRNAHPGLARRTHSADRGHRGGEGPGLFVADDLRALALLRIAAAAETTSAPSPRVASASAVPAQDHGDRLAESPRRARHRRQSAYCIDGEAYPAHAQGRRAADRRA